MKLLKIIPLTFVLLLGACSTNDTGSSSQPVNPSTPSETSELDLYGFDLKKTEDTATTETYNLANQINLHPGFSMSDLSFMVAQRTDPIVSVDSNGLLTRVRYGSTQVTVYRKAFPVSDRVFTIHFFPNADSHLGRFTAQLPAAEGHEENRVTVTIETKAENKFDLTYTAGWFSVEDSEHAKTNHEITTAIAAEGMFELESLLKFTVTSQGFPYQARFSARLDFDGSNPFIYTRVPISESGRSNFINLLKTAA